MENDGRHYCLECELEKAENLDMTLLSASTAPIGGWRFPAYGAMEESVTQIYSGKVMLPVRCRYVLDCGVV